MTPERIREYFAKDRYAALTGIEILEVREGYAKTHLTVEDKHLNGNNVVMGGCIYTMADFTFALAANCGDAESITLNSSIVFNSPASGKELFAETEIIKNGRSVCNFLVKVYDEKGRTIATSTMVGYRT